MAQSNYGAAANQGANLLGLALFAAAIGALAGVLFAPKAGTETREDLRNKYTDMKGKAQTTAHDAKDRMKSGIEAARHKVHRTTDTAADMTQEAINKADPSLAEHVEAEHSRRRTKMS
jgi:gas vesicle protein